MKICDVIKDLKGKWRGKSGNYRVDMKGDERDLTGRIDKGGVDNAEQNRGRNLWEVPCSEVYYFMKGI